MKILIVSPKNKTVFNFRGDLIKEMIAKGNDVVVVGPNKDYVEDILNLGVLEFCEIPFIKDNTSMMGDLKYLFALKKIMKLQKPDMVFSYTIKPVIYGSIAAKMAGVKKINAMVTGLGRVYASDGLKTKIIRMITKILYKIAFSFCDKVIFQNKDDIQQFVEDKYLPENKTAHVNGSGVNMDRFVKIELPDTPVFLMVGRIIKEKGVMEYCNAARKVKIQHPEARFILLGGFDSSIGALKKDDIQPYIDEGSIEFPGEVKDPVIFYQQCSVFVLPSYYREGLPRTILEAMSCGRAVITTDWPGCRDAVQDGVNGFLIPIKNSEMLKQKIECLVLDKMLVKTMSTNACHICEGMYEVSVVNETMMKYLNL